MVGASGKAESRTRKTRKSPFKWLATQVKDLTLLVVALGALIVTIQVLSPSMPQSFVDRLAVFVDKYLPVSAAEPPPPIEQEKPVDAAVPSKEDLAQAGIPSSTVPAVTDEAHTPEKSEDASAQGGPLIPVTFYPAFDDGYAYYEVSKTGEVTGHGRLGMPKKGELMPDFLQLLVGTKLKASGQVRVRPEPTTRIRQIDTIRAGECVELTEAGVAAHAVKTREARSGGWVRIRHIDCPPA